MQEVFERIIDQLKAESVIVDDDAGNRAVEIIEQAAEEFATDTNVWNNGWIPCSERLPEKPRENPKLEGRYVELYLVVEKESDYPFRAFWNGKSFTDGMFPLDVIAWQPLPQPYTKGE